MKTSQLILAVAILMVALSAVVVAHAQSVQTSYSLNLNYFTVQMTYPSQVNAGDVVTVNIQANAKNSFTSASLTAQIFYVDSNSLHQLTSATLNNNGYMNSGSALTKQITFTIPQNAPRTSLFASITENVQTAYANYYYYPANYNYSSSYCYYDVYCGYGYTYYPYSASYYAYPSYSYSTATDSGVAPLSYIKAQTPEYTALQLQYQAAEQQLNQTQAQNQQLQQQLQTAQNTIANMNQQLNTNHNMNTSLEAAVVVVGILAIVLGAFTVHYRRKGKSQTQPSNIQTHQSKTK